MRKDKNMTKKLLFPVYEFRPLKAGNYKRYANGRWIDDDGEYDLAFVELDKFMAYEVFLPYYENIRWSWCKDGDWGTNVSKHPSGNAWHYMLAKNEKYWGEHWQKRDAHPNIVAGNAAMSFCSSQKGCANGGGVEFYINDPYIKASLVREVKTKKVIKFPKTFDCMYCGEMDWQKIERIK